MPGKPTRSRCRRGPSRKHRSDPSSDSSHAREQRGWGRRFSRSAAAAHPETACARTCPCDEARVCPPRVPAEAALPGTPRAKPGLQPGATVKAPPAPQLSQ
ncbi:PREDICTED: uncharacterized protein LOC105584029 [Cercocebus atys]|uniref:uncharacterized protein LOC105584029 n=1 Tax=Cercocebus atys TaxID=9531 RepID=UPI0005F57BB8|nr:PREDICTED: uncharacterized protein LOC105584029 [Cercocebus atys]